MHVMLGVVLHEIGQLRQEEGSHLEQLCIKLTGLLVCNYAQNIGFISVVSIVSQ